jgi:hypothetical protein
MKKVCGTCIFGFDCEAGKSGINVLCAFDNEGRADSTEGCSNWEETRSGLSKKDKIDLANRLKDEESKEQRHIELLKDSKTNRKNQFLLVILGALLGILSTLLSQYIWSLWIK